MKTTNTGIVDHVRACTNPALRARIHALKIGEVLIHDKPEVQRLANSLARVTKRESGTTYSVRKVSEKHFEVQCVRFYKPSRN